MEIAMILTRLRRVVTALILATVFLFGSPADGFAGQKTVHVKEYKKKDGTTVKAHDRAASKSKADKKATSKQPLPKPPSPPPSSSTATRDPNGHFKRSET